MEATAQTTCPNCRGSGCAGQRLISGGVDDIDCLRCEGSGLIPLKTLSVDERNVMKRRGIWVDAQGNQIPFNDMTDEHLMSVFRSIKRYCERQQHLYRSAIETQWLLYGDDMQCGAPSAALRGIQNGEYFEYDEEYPSDMTDDPAFSALTRQMNRRNIEWWKL